MELEERSALASSFDALGNEKRIALLEALRAPHILADIELPADGEERNLSRQSVTKHLQRLLDAGLVARRDIVREGRDAVEFLVNHQNLYALSEAVRSLARLRPIAEPSMQTRQSSSAERAPAGGPCLVATRALDEGVTYPLEPGAGREWIIGRRRDCTVPLDFDPAVSSHHARIAWTGSAHTIEDLGSRNGTFVNLRTIGREARALAHGDIIGVGRCMLVYWSR